MTISVSQVATLGTWSGSLTGAAAIGDTLFYVVTAYTTSGTTISTSAPLYNGGSVTGATKLIEVQSPGTSATYTAIWMLPNVGSSGTSVGITVTGANTPGDTHTVGLTVLDVTGLGATPALDKSSTSKSAGGGSPTSGASGAITQAPEIVIGSLVTFGVAIAEAGAPWTETQLSDQFAAAGYQVVTSNGGSYAYATSSTSGSAWVGGVVTVSAAGAPPAPYLISQNTGFF